MNIQTTKQQEYMRKIFTLLILLLLLPVTALAAGEDAPGTLWVGRTQITARGYWKTTTEGNFETGSENDYNVYYDGNGTLTLNGATIQGGTSTGSVPYGAGIYAQCSNGQSVTLTIKLIGENTITGYYGIYVNAEISADSNGTDASLTITGENNGSLEVSGSNHGIFVKSGTGNASLNIEKATVTSSTNGGYAAGVYVQSGVNATGSPNISLSVNGGSLTASGTGNSDGILFYVGQSQATGATTSLTITDHAIVDARNGGISASRISETLPTPTPTGNNSSGIVFDDKNGTVYGNVTLQEDLEIGKDETLTIPEGSSLNGNGKLTNNGTIIVEKGGNLTGDPGGTVVSAPTIGTQPASQTVTKGNTATFSVAATGEKLSYQWQRSTDNGQSWTDISEAKAATYTTVATTTDMSGTQYRCVVSNSAGSVTSNAVTLTVNAATVSVTGVTLEPTSLSLFTGDTAPLTATVQPSDATNQNVTWESSNTEVATVDANGKVTAVGEGNATITVTTVDGSKTATCIVTVTVPVTGVKLNKETLELFTDGSETLTATVEPGNATNKNVTWSSSDETIATVDNNGTVTAVGAGKATITATAGGITATCVVHVRKPATVEASGSTNLSFTTDRNEFTLTAFVYGENLSQEPNCWEWTVANTDVVSLSDTPNLRSGSVASSRKAFTIKGTGTTTITATYDDGTYRGSVDFKVRISKPTPPDPISYYNIYVEDVCDGVEVSTSKQVVREGGSINVYVEKDTARYTFDNFKVYYKRSYYGTWDELKEGTQPGEYPIKNIWTHIYIKAEGAEEKEDPTGIESIEGVKVYTKDGSLYVQTPQREQVIIISMSGAVVKNEEQIGLKQYHGLQPGIYIVRVGDRAYKVRLN
ncbi:MAG: Ig-like domain-containing protein [Bacteroidales bacterium]|nr:Ig-like domain-containing protein [Bacteroidales bacterium]